jgi:hypothetical protein
VIAAAALANNAAAIIDERNDGPVTEALADLDGHLRRRTTTPLFRISIAPPQIGRGIEPLHVGSLCSHFLDDFFDAALGERCCSRAECNSLESRRYLLIEFCFADTEPHAGRCRSH